MSRLHSLTSLVTDPSAPHAVVLAALLLVVGCIIWLCSHVPVTVIFALGVAAEAFSGNWKNIPIPVPLDRLLFLLAIGLLIFRGVRTHSERRIVLRPVHFLLLAVGAYAVLNSFWAGSITGGLGFYSLLDRLGLIPFLMYTLAPHIFGTRRQRNIFLAVMVGFGLYLGITAILESTGPSALVFPHYISDPNVGIQQDRARGPYLESDAMALGLFDCAVFAAIALSEWTNKRARTVCWAVLGLAPIGILLTLTRADWLGAVVATVVVMALHPRLRRRLPYVAVAGVLGVVVALVVVPGLSTKFHSRLGNEETLWDRYNTNAAAERIIGAHPLFGVGWQEFQNVNWKYLREAPNYPLPLSSTNIEVHNVFLSHLAELGLVGGLMWILALISVAGGAILRRGPPELAAWKLGFLAMTIMFLIAANLAPLSYPQPNLLLWLTAGIVAVGRNSVPRKGDEEPELVDIERSLAESSGWVAPWRAVLPAPA